MITIMTKKYNSPMLQVVSIKNNDIVTASNDALNVNNEVYSGTVFAPGQRGLDDWDAGY